MMEEKDIIQMILDSSEEIEIPDSLKPENIEKKLRNVPIQHKRTVSIVRYAEIAAAVCVLLIGGYTFTQNKKDTNMKSEQTMTEAEVKSEVNCMMSAEAVEEDRGTEEAEAIEEWEVEKEWTQRDTMYLAEMAENSMECEEALPEKREGDETNLWTEFLQKISDWIRKFLNNNNRRG